MHKTPEIYAQDRAASAIEPVYTDLRNTGLVRYRIGFEQMFLGVYSDGAGTFLERKEGRGWVWVNIASDIINEAWKPNRALIKAVCTLCRKGVRPKIRWDLRVPGDTVSTTQAFVTYRGHDFALSADVLR